jgi:hypothetical protein
MYIHDVNLLLGALGISLPLYEVASRIGCHAYGCCFGARVEDVRGYWPAQVLRCVFPLSDVHYMSSSMAAIRQRPELKGVALYPIQLVSSGLFLLQSAVLYGTLYSYRYKDTRFILLLGCLSVGWHALVRLLTEQIRIDARGGTKDGQMDRQVMDFSVTGKLALFQACVAVVGVMYATTAPPMYVHMPLSLVDSLGLLVYISFTLGLVAYGYHYGHIGYWL